MKKTLTKAEAKKKRKYHEKRAEYYRKKEEELKRKDREIGFKLPWNKKARK